LDCRGLSLDLADTPVLMGIVNATPDSFFDGGLHLATSDAVQRALQLAAEGAGMIDIGGQSTRPGHSEISPEEEIARVVPVITSLASRVSVPISVDTYKPEVARAALEAGAHVINDIHGLQGSPEIARLAAEYGAAVVAMHYDAAFAGFPGDPVPPVLDFFRRTLEIAAAAGLPAERVVLDPGIGFHKTQQQNLALIARIGELHAAGRPLLLGASRKSVIAHVLGLPPDERLEGTLATTSVAVWQGVQLLRVHDIAANLRVARMTAALRKAFQ
jgi:dihydropteroate synthase